MRALVDRWRKVWQFHAFRVQLMWSAPAFVCALILLRLYLDVVEVRSAVALYDPLIAFLPALDLKWIVYSITYSALLLGVSMIAFHPLAFLLTLRAAVVVIVMRVVCLFALPLDPPVGIIPLVDPMIQLPFAYPTLTRDLFFSWHVTVMAMFAFTVPGKDLKIIFSTFGALIAALLLLQHAQYTISVVAAPCFAYAACGIAKPFTVGANGPGIPGTH